MNGGRGVLGVIAGAKAHKPLLFLAGGIGAFAAIVSVALSRHFLSVYHLPLATSGLGAVILGFIFLGGALYKLRKAR